MTEPHTEVAVAELPNCDLPGCDYAAYADANLGAGWGYVCEDHFKQFGCSLGLGLGQRLIQREET